MNDYDIAFINKFPRAYINMLVSFTPSTMKGPQTDHSNPINCGLLNLHL